MGRRIKWVTWDRPLRRSRGLYALTRKEASINTNMGWHHYYVKRFNKHQQPDAALLAMLYLFRALRDGETT